MSERAYGVSETCRMPGVTRQGRCQWRRRRPSAHDARDAELAGAVRRVWERSGRACGSPKVFRQLPGEGAVTSEKRVARIMRERGWAGVEFPLWSAPCVDVLAVYAGHEEGALCAGCVLRPPARLRLARTHGA